MLSSLPGVVRRCLGMTAPVLALLARAAKGARRRPRGTALVLALLVLAGTGVGLYAAALLQWHAAQAAVKGGRLGEAQRRLDLCLWVWPDSVPVHILAARAARLRGDFEGADAHLNCCLKLRHGATEAVQVEFLLMRVQRGEEDEVASELLSLYVDNNSPESPLILETLARAYMYHLRYEPAFTCLSRWVELEPGSAEPLRWRGWVFERLSNQERAMKDYRRALELDPDLVPVRLRLAEMLMDRSDPCEASLHLEQLHRQFPDRPDVRARLGECRFLQGQMEEARHLLESAVEHVPNDSAVLITLAKLANQEGRPEEAEPWLRRALKVDPTDTEAELTLTASLQAQGRWDEAKAMLGQFEHDTAMLKRVNHVLTREAEDPGADAGALAEVGAVFLRTNERVGLYWLNRALQRDPGHQAAHQALAEYYEGKGDPEKAAVHRRQLGPDKQAAKATSTK